MHRLRRTVRFVLRPPSAIGASPRAASSANTFASWPAPVGIGAYGELDIEVIGTPDPTTGYLVNISELDGAVRDRVVPWLEGVFADQFLGRGAIDPASCLPTIAARLAEGLPPRSAERGATVAAVAWRLSPYHQLRLEPAMPERIEIAQSFSFAASHRLHSATRDSAENRALFGKCNNPNGHGHNYRLDVVAAAPLESAPDMGTLAEVVDRVVVRRFDHKHLNADCPEFATLNPSVEHIAKVCHDLLVEPLRATGAELKRVTVWETEKTACTYPG